MANVLKTIRARERRERNAYRQKAVMAIIGCLFFLAVVVVVLWFIMINTQSARQKMTEDGISAMSYNDFVQAESLLKAADEKGETYATEFLAWMDACGGYYEEAASYAQKAVNLKRLSSYEVLGDLALMGFGPAKGTAAAISYFEQGALSLAREQAKRIEEIAAGKFEDRIDDTNNWYTMTSEEIANGSPVPEDAIQKHARDLFSGMILRALPVIGNVEDYSDLIMRAQRKGAKNLELEVGDLLFVGGGKLASNAQAAVSNWQTAMDNGYDKAIVRLAGAYWHGYSVARDPQNAIDLYTKAAVKNDPVALYALALITLRNNNPQLDPVQINQVGVELLTRASAQGYGPASTALGVFALTETNSRTAVVQAAEWLRIAALDQNDLSGRMLYDLLLMTGTGVGKEFARGFDDMMLIAEEYPPAQSILDLLQQRIPPERIMRQAMVLSNQILRGRIAYREGDPLANQTIKDPVTGEHIARPFSFYESVAYVPDSMKENFGRYNFTPITDLERITINGEKILSTDLARLIIQYAPSTGVSSFSPNVMMPRPKAPRIPPHYTIGDFVPPVDLITPQTRLDPNTGVKRTLF